MGCDIHLTVEHRDEAGEWHRVPHFDQPCDWCEGTGERDDKECWNCKGVGHGVARHYDDRDYDVFAILANVRNGFGFAGVNTGDGFEPLTVGRGLPSDLCAEAREHLARAGYAFVAGGEPEFVGGEVESEEFDWEEPGRYAREWAYDLGEHSFTWLLWSELQNDEYWAKTTTLRGWVGAEEYAIWRDHGRPQSWSGGVSGRDVRHVSHEQMDEAVRRGEAEDCYTLVEWDETYGEAAARFLAAIRRVVEHVGEDDPERIRLTMGFDS